MAKADFCASCSLPLAESRILQTIASGTRQELRLGQSKRAILDRELQKLNYLLEVEPQNKEQILFRKAKTLRQMKFSAREAQTWKSFLQEFPTSRRAVIAKVYLSEALRRWSYLYYEQKNLEKALERLQEAVVANPANGEGWSWLSRVFFETDQKQEAEKAAREALKYLPNDETALYVLRRLGKPATP